MVCFELKSHVGGLWNSVDETPDAFVDQHGYTLESIYEELVSIVPSVFMTFKDFSYQGENSHMTR